MKYVVLEITHGVAPNQIVREVPVMFGESLVHADVAKGIIKEAMLKDHNIARIKPVAAGFFSCVHLNQVQFHGRSESLNLDSRGEEDRALVGMHDYLHGLV